MEQQCYQLTSAGADVVPVLPMYYSPISLTLPVTSLEDRQSGPAGRPAGPVEGQTQTFSEKRKPYRYSRGWSFAVIRLSKSASADQDPDKGHSEPASDKIRSRLSSRLRPFALVKHKSLPVINPPASPHLLTAYIDQLLQPFWSGSRPITRRACASRRC